MSRAFHHAREDLLLMSAQQRGDSDLNGRRKLLWWCCIIRERMLALGMQRPHRLHTTAKGRPLPVGSDFGFELNSPKYTNVTLKRELPNLFLLFCKLSIIMEDVAIFQRKAQFSRKWNSDATLTSEEARHVWSLDQAMRSWKEELSHAIINRRSTRRINPLVYILKIIGRYVQVIYQILHHALITCHTRI